MYINNFPTLGINISNINVVSLIRASCKICAEQTSRTVYGNNLPGSWAAKEDSFHIVYLELGRLMEFFRKKGGCGNVSLHISVNRYADNNLKALFTVTYTRGCDKYKHEIQLVQNEYLLWISSV